MVGSTSQPAGLWQFLTPSILSAHARCASSQPNCFCATTCAAAVSIICESHAWIDRWIDRDGNRCVSRLARYMVPRCYVARNPESKCTVYGDPLIYQAIKLSSVHRRAQHLLVEISLGAAVYYLSINLSVYLSHLSPRLVRLMPLHPGVARHARQMPGNSVGTDGLASGPPRECFRVVPFPHRECLFCPHRVVCGVRIVHFVHIVIDVITPQGGEATKGPAQTGMEAHLGCVAIGLARPTLSLPLESPCHVLLESLHG